jgi:hypothetical protein
MPSQLYIIFQRDELDKIGGGGSGMLDRCQPELRRLI